MNALTLKRQLPHWRWALEVILVLDLIVIGLFGLAALVIWWQGPIAQDPVTHDYFGSEMDIGLLAYKVNVGSYPTTAQGLQALITQPAGVRNWHGPYLTGNHIPLDPWGHSYHYAYPSTHGQPAGKYDCWSLGPDAKDGTKDDIGNWPD